MPTARKSLAFSLVLWLWVPLQLALIVMGLWRCGSVNWPMRIEFMLAVGVCCGAVGMTFAHELLHRPSRFERALAEILLSSMTYPQLCIEHLVGHHRNYGKPCDYGTARFGESFYHAMFRCIKGSLATSWRAEKSRLGRKGRGAFDPRNRMFRYGATLASAYGAAAYFGGAAGLCFFAGQSAIAVAMLHSINYLEHYGLVRREIAPGVYEPAGPYLSWDAPGLLTDWFAIHVQRHSDHHRTCRNHINCYATFRKPPAFRSATAS